uniref:ATP synthase F0 subunit 8 n=1 Tax=Mydaus javanensis TaxID=311557 RepID=UPI0023AB522B|nr:ATP synthase F0 subunit 8 [Mydaus javanensis]WCO87461.1 ATP synthase F0 subunit 8 [Mydaus javanensis]
MPQLDTSTWLITITSMIITLFMVLQPKISKHNFPENPQLKATNIKKTNTPWEEKWTKIYSPLSLPLQ